jgi:hypothetical protein
MNKSLMRAREEVTLVLVVVAVGVCSSHQALSHQTFVHVFNVEKMNKGLMTARVEVTLVLVVVVVGVCSFLFHKALSHQTFVHVFNVEKMS